VQRRIRNGSERASVGRTPPERYDSGGRTTEGDAVPDRAADRPDCIKHWAEIQDPDDARNPGSDELLSIGSAFGRAFGLSRLGI
jgi:hypothetical protein